MYSHVQCRCTNKHSSSGSTGTLLKINVLDSCLENVCTQRALGLILFCLPVSHFKQRQAAAGSRAASRALCSLRAPHHIASRRPISQDTFPQGTGSHRSLSKQWNEKERKKRKSFFFFFFSLFCQQSLFISKILVFIFKKGSTLLYLYCKAAFKNARANPG